VRSRHTALSALTLRQLKRLAIGVGISPRLSKNALVASICRKRNSLAELLGRLTCDDLAAIACRLSLDASDATKDELVGLISADHRRLLRGKIVKSLRRQGFRIRDGRIGLPDEMTKDQLRTLHSEAVKHKQLQASSALARKEDKLLSWIANGDEVEPSRIRPTMVEVHRGSFEEQLFRYTSLHWAIPVSPGYGRRLRYVVIDAHVNKLIGLIGLGDPVFALAPRDAWIGWTQQQRSTGLHHVVDAYVLGAIPPYSRLLCGKLVAMLAASREVSARFQEKYGDREALISGKRRSGEIAMLTTTSALGRSSIYNRLRFGDRLMYVPVGFTQGSGDFQFLNGLYEEMNDFATASLKPTAKNRSWGTGFRNRREVVRKCLDAAGLREGLLYHGVRREIFVVPLASNSAAYLRGEDNALSLYAGTVPDLIGWFSERWLRPRAATATDYKAFTRDSYRLWGA
jgi:Domain of unknown function (DUF4338)